MAEKNTIDLKTKKELLDGLKRTLEILPDNAEVKAKIATTEKEIFDATFADILPEIKPAIGLKTPKTPEDLAEFNTAITAAYLALNPTAVTTPRKPREAHQYKTASGVLLFAKDGSPKVTVRGDAFDKDANPVTDDPKTWVKCETTVATAE